ncbi:MAG TPA: hydroxyacid dehydrogenase [Bryobacteraceae bacterium]|nr:hydroxyacid dehydrogenase [Bryobacteraceae bacterium]
MAAVLPEISIPDDAPPVLARSAVWPDLAARATLRYHDTLPGSEERLIERIGTAEIVLNIRSSSRFTARVFAACPRLRLLSVWGTGTDHVDLEAAARHGVTVTNTPGVSAVSIAEHALALLLAVARRIPQMDAATRRGEWPRGQSVELHGKTCGIIGLGAVGRQFARLAAAIGMRVVAWTMHPKPIPAVELLELDTLYRESDVVSVHLRLSRETEGFIGMRQFGLMKPGAILINTARGAIVDEAALLEALESGRIAGAGLDVFTVEPLPPGHPLTKLPNVALTPHCAGITPEALEAGLRMAVENIWSYAP